MHKSTPKPPPGPPGWGLPRALGAIFALSAGAAGAGFALFVVPMSAPTWEELGSSLPGLIASIHAHGIWWAVAALACGVAATLSLFLIRSATLRMALYVVLAAVPALITLAGIMAWWSVYAQTLTDLSSG